MCVGLLASISCPVRNYRNRQPLELGEEDAGAGEAEAGAGVALGR